MNLNFLCCIGAELKNSVQQTTRMTQVYLYRAFEEETIADMLATGFFNDALGIIRQDDLLLLYSPNETKSKYVYARVSDVSSAGVVIEVIKIDASTISVDTTGYSNLSGNNLQEILNNLDTTITTINNAFVRKDGSSVMTGPLKFRAGSFVGAIAGGLGDGVSFYKLKSDNTIDSEVASLTKTDGFTPGTTNAQDIGSNSLKWKDLYVARVIAGVLNNGANISVPTVGGTMALVEDINNKISNCITEIPQDITLKLYDNAGTPTLRLKSGSKVYKPNGSGVFDTYTLSADKTFATSSNGTYVMYLTSVNAFDIVNINNVYSGNTQPTGVATYSLWYDTANNLVRKTNDGGTTWSSTVSSFPICVFTSTNGAISSIDQVFNGFGYIGSTVFVLPGVKGFIPNGRNTDGTLKSTSLNVSNVITKTFTGTANTILALKTNTVIEGNGIWYDSTNNYNYYSSSSTSPETCLPIARVTLTSGTVSNWDPRLVFAIIDRTEIANLAMPSKRYTDLTLGVSGTTYTAPADGYFTVNKSGSDGEWMYMINMATNMNISVSYPASINGRLFMPAARGDRIQIQYSASGTVNMFRFIYANGAK